jgi:hypothetical protein
MNLSQTYSVLIIQVFYNVTQCRWVKVQSTPEEETPRLYEMSGNSNPVTQRHVPEDFNPL